MSEGESKPKNARALPYLLIGAVIILSASLTPTRGHNRPKLDASGQPIYVDGHSYPIFERDTAAEFRSNWPTYFCSLVGIGFIARAAVIRFSPVAHVHDNTRDA